MSYQRVLPRDLFNESKLLKCMGRVSLLIHASASPPDCVVGKFYNPSRPREKFGLWLDHDDPESGFIIAQNQDDGHLYVVNLTLRNHDSGEAIHLFTAYNSKDPYPLFFEGEAGDILSALDDNGDFTPWFLAHAASLRDSQYENETD